MTLTPEKIRALAMDFRAARKIPHCLPAPETCDGIEAALGELLRRVERDEQADRESPRRDKWGHDPFRRPQ